MNPGTANGEAPPASVSTSTMEADEAARGQLLSMAEDMENGPARERILALAQELTTPRERLLTLADEAEAAAGAIKDKMVAMDETRKARLAEAKEFRATAKNLES